MAFRASILFACLLLASAAGAETVYKYRHPDGKVTYSNKRLAGLELIETFDVRFPPPAPAAVRKADPADEARINKRLAALDAAWLEVQEATTALGRAEARFAAAAAPFEEENASLGGPPALAPGEAPKPGVLSQVAPEVGGPQGPVAQAVGGPAPAASPAVGGPMGTRRGGGRNPEYHARMAELEADVVKARARLEVAYQRYNALR